jgi:hypothetical protein
MDKLKAFLTLLFWRKELNSSAKWFDKNQPAQDRFWELEDWSEELEERIVELEANSHPCKELHEFEVYPELINRITTLENELNNISNKIDSK